MLKVMLFGCVLFMASCYGYQQLCELPKCSEGKVGFCAVNDDEQCIGICSERQAREKGHTFTVDTFSRRLNSKECSSESYEPDIIFSEGKCFCIEKSKCLGVGQIVASDGSIVEDRTCRCDYSIGYGYSQNPKNLCSCIPKLENCNCEFKVCKPGHRLSPDYDCIDEAALNQSSFTCPFIGRSSSSDDSTDTTGNRTRKERRKKHRCMYKRSCVDLSTHSAVAIIIIVVIVVLGVGIIIGLFLARHVRGRFQGCREEYKTVESGISDAQHDNVGCREEYKTVPSDKPDDAEDTTINMESGISDAQHDNVENRMKSQSNSNSFISCRVVDNGDFIDFENKKTSNSSGKIAPLSPRSDEKDDIAVNPENNQ